MTELIVDPLQRPSCELPRAGRQQVSEALVRGVPCSPFPARALARPQVSFSSLGRAELQASRPAVPQLPELAEQKLALDTHPRQAMQEQLDLAPTPAAAAR